MFLVLYLIQMRVCFRVMLNICIANTASWPLPEVQRCFLSQATCCKQHLTYAAF